MAIVSYVLEDCPGCGRKNSFGNVDIFNGDHVYQGCKSCRHHGRVPLPKLRKKILYLDQFFFSHALRGGDTRFVEAAKRIARMTSLQLLVAPYSTIHEDEAHQWSQRGEELFKFIKATSGGCHFAPASEVNRFQLLKAFRAWLLQKPADYHREESDAFWAGADVHGWHGYMRISVGKYLGDIDLIRELKKKSIEGLVELFDGWRELDTSYAEDLNAEYEVAARAYIDHYIKYAARIAGGDYSAIFDAPVIVNVVESMFQCLSRELSPEDQMQACVKFLLLSQHFKEAPAHKISAAIYATHKSMVKDGAFTNKEKALKRFSGFFYDVEHISTYAPYCDAFVMDQPMADIVAKPTVALQRLFGTKVFSLNNWDEFIAWLDDMEKGMSEEHKSALIIAYPQ
jgi:hypothetical protein